MCIPLTVLCLCPTHPRLQEEDLQALRTHSGTVTHMAPELLQGCGVITFAVDVYAFGILMWELFTGAGVYSGLSSEEIRRRVLEEGLRPVFPPGAPEGEGNKLVLLLLLCRGCVCM